MILFHPIDCNTPGQPIDINPNYVNNYLKKGFTKTAFSDNEIIEYFEKKHNLPIQTILTNHEYVKNAFENINLVIPNSTIDNVPTATQTSNYKQKRLK